MPAAKKNLSQRILAISSDLGAVAKTGQMRGGGGTYEFHRIDDIEDKLRGLLIQHGVAVYPRVTHNSIECNVVRERAQYSTEVVVDLTLVNAEDPTDQQVVSGYGQGLDYSDKGPGKAMSYAIKSLYLFLFHLKGQPDNEDDDIQRDSSVTNSAPRTAAKKKGTDKVNGAMSPQINDLKRNYVQLFPQANADNWRAYVNSYLNEDGDRQFNPLDDRTWTKEDVKTISDQLTEINKSREPVKAE